MDSKSEPAVGLPSGWRFYFVKPSSSTGPYRFKPVPGLYIIAGDKKFRSVEAAMSWFKLPGESEAARKFYTHVGLLSQVEHYEDEVATAARPHQKSIPSACSTNATTVASTDGPCGMCENCTRDSCRECARCTCNNVGVNQLCFQKVQCLTYDLNHLLHFNPRLTILDSLSELLLLTTDVL